MIREITDNDRKKIYEIIKKEFKNNYLKDNPFTKWYIYELNNEIVGFINIDIIYEKAEIEYIYVVEKWRKNKIATKLLEKAEKDLINKRVSTITLEVNVNNFSAIKFYEKNEYKKINIRKHYYGNDDAYLMLKELVVE
jgi:ribosomal-protein-alanine N-acetyltransferase